MVLRGASFTLDDDLFLTILWVLGTREGTDQTASSFWTRVCGVLSEELNRVTQGTRSVERTYSAVRTRFREKKTLLDSVKEKKTGNSRGAAYTLKPLSPLTGATVSTSTTCLRGRLISTAISYCPREAGAAPRAIGVAVGAHDSRGERRKFARTECKLKIYLRLDIYHTSYLSANRLAR